MNKATYINAQWFGAIFVVILIVVTIFINDISITTKDSHNNLYSSYKQSKMTFKKNVLNFYIADTREKKMRGLSYSKFLPTNWCMLFTFENRSKHAFWMKGMQYGLDFIFVDSNIVVDVLTNVLPQSYPEAIRSRYDSDLVIECNIGTIDHNKIMLGDVFLPDNHMNQYKKVKINFVYDGDTVRIIDQGKNNVLRIRYIDAPEIRFHTGEDECYAKEAKDVLKRAVLNKTVMIEKIEEKDKYGRILSQIIYEDNGYASVGVFLLRDGFARAYKTEKASIYTIIENKAREHEMGLWKDCK